MLNMYFVFGVPIFLLFLYATIAYVRKRTTIHYLGFYSPDYFGFHASLQSSDLAASTS